MGGAILSLCVVLTLSGPGRPIAQDNCEPYTVTAYAQEDFPGATFDGTPTRGNVGVIAAGSLNLPIDTIVWIEGFGQRRIADRGRLGSRHVDVLVQTRAEAIQIGRSTATVCR